MKLMTKNGRDFYVVASLLQKSLRRGDIVLASRAANELLPKYANYCWNRLMTVSAEDCADFVTGEIVALYDAWSHVNRSDRDNARGRIFLAKAIIVLARARHSRDADELNLLVSDRMPDAVFDAALANCGDLVEPVDFAWDGEVPQWVYDCHTRIGKSRGKTKADFVREEHDALTDQQTLFTNFDEMADSSEYVEPQVDLP
jgi:replication-associated recombination protein RarA